MLVHIFLWHPAYDNSTQFYYLSNQMTYAFFYTQSKKSDIFTFSN